MIVYHKGSFIDEKAVYSAADRLRLGDGFFDTMLVVNGATQHAGLHRARLEKSARVMYIDLDLQGWDQHIQSVLSQNNLQTGRAVIRTLITAGQGGHGLKRPESAPYITIMAEALPDTPPPDIHAVIVPDYRRNEGSPLSQIKLCAYAESILALKKPQTQGGNEALLLNNAGHVVCASTSNIFVVMNGALITPPLSDGAVDGVIRRLVLECHPAKEQSLTLEDLQNCEGFTLTNSVRGVRAVHSLNGQVLPEPTLNINL